MIEYFVGTVLGFGLGFFSRPKFELRQDKKLEIIYPTQIGFKGTYVVKFDGRVIYQGEDLQEAKRLYKMDYPNGHVLEFYNCGNHVVSRETKNGSISSRA